MYCPHVLLAYYMLLHSSFGSFCVEGLCVTWLVLVSGAFRVAVVYFRLHFGSLHCEFY